MVAPKLAGTESLKSGDDHLGRRHEWKKRAADARSCALGRPCGTLLEEEDGGAGREGASELAWVMGVGVGVCVQS